MKKMMKKRGAQVCARGGNTVPPGIRFQGSRSGCQASLHPPNVWFIIPAAQGVLICPQVDRDRGSVGVMSQASFLDNLPSR